MPDILIRGMEMPTMEQAYKTLIISYDGKVYEGVHPQPTAKKKEPIAEAVELPPHGDFVDATQYRDEFMYGVYNMCADDSDNNRANAIIDLYDCAPVIVPSNKEETE